MNRPGRFWPQAALGCIFWLMALAALAVVIYVFTR